MSADKPSQAAPTATERILDMIGGAQSLALGMTKQATGYAAERIPPVKGFPPDVLDGVTEVVDQTFEAIENALAERSPAVRDVVHQQGTFVRGIFTSLQPIVDALAGEEATHGGADE